MYLIKKVGDELNSWRAADLHTTARLMETAEHELRFYSCCAWTTPQLEQCKGD